MHPFDLDCIRALISAYPVTPIALFVAGIVAHGIHVTRIALGGR